MTFALARALLLADAVTPDALAQALLLSATSDIPLVRALLAMRAIDGPHLEQLLDRGDAPYMRHVAPVMSLVHRLPPGLCERLLALPVRRDARTGTVDVALVDARDSHPVEEIAYWLKVPVRMVRTSLASMEAALKRIGDPEDEGVRSLAPPIWLSAPEATEDSATSSSVDMPIPLTRRSSPRLPNSELGCAAVEKGSPDAVPDPVLDLKRRKSSMPSLPNPAPSGPGLDGPLSSPAATARGPFSPGAPTQPFEDVEPILAEIRNASNRDRVLDLIVAGVRTVARRVAVLGVRHNTLVGWTCSRELGSRAALRGVQLPMSARTVLHEAIDRPAARLVRIPKDAAHAPFIAVMSTPPMGEVALAGIHVEGKPVLVVLADELGDVLVVTKRMDDLAAAAGESLARLLRERRK